MRLSRRSLLEERVADVVKQNDYSDQCNVIEYKNEYGREVFVELHSIHDDGIWVDGELGLSDLDILANALRIIRGRNE
jgi:hypothetical protein